MGEIIGKRRIKPKNDIRFTKSMLDTIIVVKATNYSELVAKINFEKSLNILSNYRRRIR